VRPERRIRSDRKRDRARFLQDQERSLHLALARTHVSAGRIAALVLNRFVQRGEKGIFILAPMVGNKRKKDETEQATDAKETQRTL
jgi:hypothetical protein